MLTTVAAERGGPVAYGQEQTPGTYRMGIAVSEVDGLEVYQHTGFWGTTAAYVPQLDLAIGLAVTQQGSPAQQALFRQALDAVRAANRRVR
jgi:CubicO group peptidase (beta-lactamase class C family)